MRGKVARQMRQMVRHIFTDEKVWVEYTTKEVAIYNLKNPKYHPDVQQYGKVTVLTEDCGRAFYLGAKRNYKVYV